MNSKAVSIRARSSVRTALALLASITLAACSPSSARTPPPSTDATVGEGGSNGTGGLPIVLVAIAGILAASLALLPRRRTNK